MKKVEVLDGVRGLAIILVMIYHFSLPFQHSEKTTWLDQFFYQILQTGWIGVDFFFALSGFLITAILISTRDNESYFKNFYVRRVLRIFPLYYGFLLFILVVFPYLSESYRLNTESMQENSFWFWTYLVNWKIATLGSFNGFQGGYMWSLAVEEQFYLVWPLVVYYFHKKIPQISVITIVVMLVAKWVMLTKLGITATTIYVLPFTHLDALLLGATLASLYMNGNLSHWVTRFFKPVAITAVLSLALLYFVEGRFVYNNNMIALIGLPLLGILASCIISYLLVGKGQEKSNVFFKLFNNNVLRKFGVLCYGLYLFHQPIGVVINSKVIPYNAFELWGSYIPSTLLSISLSIFVSYVVALLSFNIYEKHFLKLKKYFV